MFKKYFLLVFLLLSNFVIAQFPELSSQSQISVLTVGTADASHSLYGHTALRVKDKNFDIVYNYGMFDFSTPNFMLKFVKGDLQYYAAAYNYSDFEYNYRLENRSILEQVLHISFEEKKKLFDLLNNSLSGDEKYYTYKFIDRNCTTKVLEKVNEVIGKDQIVKQNINKDVSYRDILFGYVSHHFYQKLGINIIFGAQVDKVASTIFLPDDLYTNLALTQHQGNPLVSESKTLFEAHRTPPKSYLDNIYTLIITLGFLILINKKWIYLLYFFITGILGVFFCFIGLYSFHQEVLWNYNALLFNPLYLFLLYGILFRKTLFTRKIIIAIGIMTLGYIIYMLNKIHLWIVTPFVITHLIILYRIYKK